MKTLNKIVLFFVVLGGLTLESARAQNASTQIWGRPTPIPAIIYATVCVTNYGALVPGVLIEASGTTSTGLPYYASGFTSSNGCVSAWVPSGRYRLKLSKDAVVVETRVIGFYQDTRVIYEHSRNTLNINGLIVYPATEPYDSILPMVR